MAVTFVPESAGGGAGTHSPPVNRHYVESRGMPEEGTVGEDDAEQEEVNEENLYKFLSAESLQLFEMLQHVEGFKEVVVLCPCSLFLFSFLCLTGVFSVPSSLAACAGDRQGLAHGNIFLASGCQLAGAGLASFHTLSFPGCIVRSCVVGLSWRFL